MVRIIYEHPDEWPPEGPLRIEAQFSSEILVQPELARRRANGYLAQEVALFLVGGDPLLVLNDHPCWRIPAILRLRGVGELAEVGSVDVDAQTGAVKPLTEEDIQVMRERAHAIASRLAPSAETTS